jgi:hypothetical protein
MYTSPDRLRDAVRSALKFGESFPLPGSAERGAPGRLARWRPMNPSEVLAIQGLGRKFKPPRLLRARIAFLRGER